MMDGKGGEGSRGSKDIFDIGEGTKKMKHGKLVTTTSIKEND